MRKSGARRRLHFSIGFKLITITTIIVAASLGGMIFLASYFFRDDNEIRIKENNLQVAGLIAKKVLSDVTAIVDKVGMIGNLLQAEKDRLKDAGSTADGKSAARSVFDTDRDILFAAIVEKDGTDKPVIRESLVNRDFAAERGQDEAAMVASLDPILPSFSGSFTGQSIVANPSPRLGYGALAFAVPYQKISTGEARSILVILVRLERFNETVKSQGITRSYIVNGAGDVLAHFDQSLVTGGANLASSPVIRMMLKSTNPNGQTRYQESDNRWYLGSFQKVEFADLGVIVYVDEEKAFEAVYRIQRRNMLITALVLNFAMLIVWFFAKTITKPVKRLARAALQVKEGQYDIGIAPTSRDEIGDLTGTFVEMAQGLAEREKMKEAFGKFVNKEIAEKAMKGELKLGGERKDVAIFFSDIRSFTAISEKLQPEEVVEFLNAYMTRMVACVNE
ncbi:MAG TPA: HAMP domain-containing protein, partial [Spirochaetota bacterium]|nr:HAMP domain-containing protein [Spirochaetota bacterium]